MRLLFGYVPQRFSLWMADTNRLGYEGGALVFGAGLALVAAGGSF
jgi:hypothetical protein